MGDNTYITCTVCNVAHWNLMGTMPTDGSYVCKDCIKKMRARIADLEKQLAEANNAILLFTMVNKDLRRRSERTLEAQQTEGSWPGVYFNTRHGEIVEATEYCAKLERTLASSGFAPCDIPACNCGGWHKRDGQVLREIMQACREITKVKISSDILVPDELCDHVDQLAALLGELDAIQ